jgi:hypothetical protein
MRVCVDISSDMVVRTWWNCPRLRGCSTCYRRHHFELPLVSLSMHTSLCKRPHCYLERLSQHPLWCCTCYRRHQLEHPLISLSMHTSLCKRPRYNLGRLIQHPLWCFTCYRKHHPGQPLVSLSMHPCRHWCCNERRQMSYGIYIHRQWHLE